MATQQHTVGDFLRGWRSRRRLSQLDLAGDAEISARHLSFVESGRSSPSRDLLLRLAETLSLPLRERNRLLLAGGFAPLHGERTIDAPDMAAAKAAVDAVLRGHLPFPALAVDRHWNLVLANEAVGALLTGVDPALTAFPTNVLRLSLHPDGLAPRIVNLEEWRHDLLTRLQADAELSSDPTLFALHEELSALPAPKGMRPRFQPSRVAVPLMLREAASGQVLSFLSTTTVFGTAIDVTLSELTLECFYPADEETRRALVGG